MIKEAIFAGGCFWGVEYYMKRSEGVISIESGYTGGSVIDPKYLEVKSGSTGHAEAVRIKYDDTKTNYETLLKLFMEIHDPTQLNGQGYDLGTQYRSELYYADQEQKETIDKIISILRDKGMDIVTRVCPQGVFYRAEEYHQDYYDQKGTLPDCHSRKRLFD